MRKSIATLAGSGLLLLSSAAAAQQPYGYSGAYNTGTYGPGAMPSSASGVDNIGVEGQFVLGVERITGLFWQRDTASVNDQDVTQKHFTLGLLGMSGVTPSSVPRVAGDFFVIDSLSVGGSVAYFSDAPSRDPELPGGASPDSTNGFLLNPRVGYAYVLDETFAIWPRLGFMYAHSSTGDASSSRTNLTIDAMLTISPVEHVIFSVGPMLDLGLGGSADQSNGAGETTSVDTKLTSYGLTAGLGTYFP